jgi:hypothetical protein
MRLALEADLQLASALCVCVIAQGAIRVHRLLPEHAS